MTGLPFEAVSGLWNSGLTVDETEKGRGRESQYVSVIVTVTVIFAVMRVEDNMRVRESAVKVSTKLRREGEGVEYN